MKELEAVLVLTSIGKESGHNVLVLASNTSKEITILQNRANSRSGVSKIWRRWVWPGLLPRL
jgi:hypothetical protein